VFTVQTERIVRQDNTVAIKDRWWQIDKCQWRHSLAGQTVTIHEHLNGSVSIRFRPHVVGRYPEGRGNDASGASHISTANVSLSPLSPKTKAKRVA
jgi:hypothetical protein